MLWLQLVCILLILQSVTAVAYRKKEQAKKVETTTKKAPPPEKHVEPWEHFNYCTLKCGKEQHIACNNTGKAGSRCPPNVKVFSLDESIRHLILSLHNEKRDEVAGGIFNKLPTAERMGIMLWDNELAHLAKLKALQCSTATDHCHSTAKFENPGQTVSLLEYKNDTATFSLKALVENRINDWFSGSSLLKPNIINKFHENKHPPHMAPFALAIMDKNNHIGCGAVDFENNSKKSFYLVCNYERKLKNGDVVYKTGNPASECASGKAKNYKHLCSSKEKYQ